MSVSTLTKETKIASLAKGSFPKCLFLPIFDHVELPYWMSYNPERPGLAGKLELCLTLCFAAGSAVLAANWCS